MGNLLTNHYQEIWIFNKSNFSAEILEAKILENLNSLPYYEIITDPEEIDTMFPNEKPNQKDLEEASKIIYAVFISSRFGYVDDIIFLINDKKESCSNVIVRSTSRKGLCDFRKNKKHVREIMNFIY